MSKKNGGPPSSSSSLDYIGVDATPRPPQTIAITVTLATVTVWRAVAKLNQTLSSPTAKVPRSRVPSDTTTLLFSATLGFSELLQTGSRDRLSSQSHNDEIVAEM